MNMNEIVFDKLNASIPHMINSSFSALRMPSAPLDGGQPATVPQQTASPSGPGLSRPDMLARPADSAPLRQDLGTPPTLLGPHLDKLRSARQQGLEYFTGVAVALQTDEISRMKKEEVPPLMLSFSESALRGAHDVAPHLPRVLNVEAGALPDNWLDLLHELDCVAIDLYHRDVTPEIVDAAHKAGFRVMCYTPNDPARIEKLFSWGVDNTITDMIHLVKPDGYQRWDRKTDPDSNTVKLPPWPYHEAVGHRFAGKTTGEFSVAPENTMAGAQAACAYGYRAVEYDVNVSSDDIPVPFVMHDATLERTTNATGSARKPWSELASASAGARHSKEYAAEPIPTDLAIASYLIDQGVQRMVEIKPLPDTSEPL
jgi:glycerophosphoryl diester phosphodiesterase